MGCDPASIIVVRPSSGASGGTIVANRRQYGPSSATAISSSAWDASAAEAGRSAGFLASIRSTQPRTASGVSGASSASGGGALWTWQ